MHTGVVFNIQKCSIHDGPGIRTLVFLKGCPLRCLWCSNPESQKVEPEIASLYKRCIGCRACEKICPQKAISYDNGKMLIDKKLCNNCNLCVDVCCTDSKQVMGKKMTVDEVLTEILKDRPFYKKLGGGVTFSGGEPLMQSNFLLEILKECKDFGINTSIETSGYGSYSVLEEASNYLDTIHFDIKHMNEIKHKELTGVSNKLISDNLIKLNNKLKERKIIVRIPVIPGYNDSEENIRLTAQFCTQLKAIKRMELLPYHNLGEHKYKSINRNYELGEVKAPDENYMKKLMNIAKNILYNKGIECLVLHS
ncbi:glycyl-radical enzyme activating protein [Clostridium fermenticellae]|uniref:Glycyl-radical enzyme activating protein n=1 Tax=Clostridium fermenticellae TaxID=2068654 RepID=A0A386H4H4_9CLOT|nr:glycyl-radical enzyme activating protein [Clostridium fermenticellae]AYD40534.1 glycyl-radical enzyme activating protein [Clostridium fermenticellae]